MFKEFFENRSSQMLSGTDWTRYVRGEDIESVSYDSTYRLCLEIYSDTIAKLPINILEKTEKGTITSESHYLSELLRLRPNPSMSAFETKKLFFIMLKHYGCAGLYIDRHSNGQVKALYPVKINYFVVDDEGLIKSKKQNKVLVNYTCYNVTDYCLEKDIIICKENTIDGFTFTSTKEIMKDTIESNVRSQKYQTQLFANGLTNKIAVQLTSDIKDQKEIRKIQEKFNKIYSSNGRIFTVPAGYSIQALNLSLADSQFAELKIQGKKDICVALGIPFSLLDTGTLSQDDNVSFLSNAIIPKITNLEEEMNYKLLTDLDRKKHKIRVNVNVMLRTSPEVQSNIIKGYVQQGIYTLNDAKRILDIPLVEGGDTVTLPSGQVTLDTIINGNAVWQKDTKGGDE